MPNVTVYLDDKSYVEFYKLEQSKQEEIKKMTQKYLKKKIEGNKEIDKNGK